MQIHKERDILMALACHVTSRHLQVFARTGYQSLSVVAEGWGGVGVQLVTFALWEPEVRCPGFIFSLVLHLLQTCLCAQGSSDEAAGGGERDLEDGHLIYKSGDVIEGRCTSQFDHRAAAPYRTVTATSPR